LGVLGVLAIILVSSQQIDSPLSPACGGWTSLLSMGLKVFDTTPSQSKGEIFDLYPSPKRGETPQLRTAKLLNQGFQRVLSFFLFFSNSQFHMVAGWLLPPFDPSMNSKLVGKQVFQGFQAVLRLIFVFFHSHSHVVVGQLPPPVARLAARPTAGLAGHAGRARHAKVFFCFFSLLEVRGRD